MANSEGVIIQAVQYNQIALPIIKVTYLIRWMVAMSERLAIQSAEYTEITVEDVNRLLEVGRILASVLTKEELEQLQENLSRQSAILEIGNTGVS
jgi:hypothetical protein